MRVWRYFNRSSWACERCTSICATLRWASSPLELVAVRFDLPFAEFLEGHGHLRSQVIVFELGEESAFPRRIVLPRRKRARSGRWIPRRLSPRVWVGRCSRQSTRRVQGTSSHNKSRSKGAPSHVANRMRWRRFHRPRACVTGRSTRREGDLAVGRRGEHGPAERLARPIELAQGDGRERRVGGVAFQHDQPGLALVRGDPGKKAYATCRAPSGARASDHSSACAGASSDRAAGSSPTGSRAASARRCPTSSLRWSMVSWLEANSSRHAPPD